MIQPELVAVELDRGAQYGAEPPFHPSERYPELPQVSPLGPRNDGFRMVRSALQRLGMDAAHAGSVAWNPLGELIRPGEHVVLKPNMIRQSHETRPGDWDYVITHGSVIRAVSEYAARALGGHGRISIADGPQTDSLYDRIKALMGLEEIAAYLRETYGVDVALVDIRREWWKEKDGIYTKRVPLPGDPYGYVRANLGRRSRFVGKADRPLYGAYYDMAETNQHHHGDVHEYMFSGTALAADVFINLPKLKTHKKCGVTLNLKNLVGCNGDKNWLPHYAIGVPSEGGDQFPEASIKHRAEQNIVGFVKRRMLDRGGRWITLARRFKQLGYRVFGDTSRVVRSGNWYGNDTIWRMVLDLNAIMLYGDLQGTLDAGRRRRFFSVVDGIVAGEGNGPLAPERVRAGLVVAGGDPVAVDAVTAELIGFDWRRIQHLSEAFAPAPLPIAAVEPGSVTVVSNESQLARAGALMDPPELYHFEPHFGWKGHIERQRTVAAV